ncbi:hypothetical protein AAEO56_17820 [Flavobacterium sp. DGU11]|uniref:Replication initiation factor n=1 Tax=Flavobacterium arundinis TaxID=3139143 RepID=A0ABU9I130_9FLAO
MIDNIRFKVLEREILEHHIKKTHVVDLSTSLNLFTGEESQCPMKGKYFNMDVVLSCQGAYVKGSIHKLTNLLKGGKGHNYNDLSFCSASESIAHLIEAFGLQKTSLTNLELGLNIHISKDPQHFLDYNLLMYDSESHNKDLKFRGKGDYKEFHKTDYSLKIYNKSKQYGIRGNILRVEVKIISKRKLQQLGIFSLEDLQREDIVNRIYSFLWEELQKLTIIDDFTNVQMPPEDKNSLNEYTNPHYWKKLSRDRSYKVRKDRQRKFKALIVKYGLDTTQREILKGVSEKFAEMMDCEASQINKLAA